MHKFSIIVPVFNEEKNIILLIDEIINLLQNKFYFEIIIIDDGSTDNSYQKVKELQEKIPLLTIFKHERNFGQSQSILTGIKISKYETIVTIDGDGQNNPNDIIKLAKIFFGGTKYSLLGGIRQIRKDSKIKIISSKIANSVRKFFLKDNCEDTGCSLKIFDKNIFLKLPFFDGIHRFLPALFIIYGKTYFIQVDHRSRLSGVSKYGILKRLIFGIRDLLKVLKIKKKLALNERLYK